ncbi:alpha-glucanase [Colletotrichum truncatum]|uniref:Alpha-glucanase n=1 Tax=Colletotrichum truncatum TaxID=5467 RepID=A0ACC3ZLF9_COLTU|nr:alpha-glucanase [Colletotrichum truncatum]KAF6786893.1 alpha-glucanase [Colletotrichum truncatum]
MPVYMLQSAVKSMNEIKRIGVEVQKRDQEHLIIMVLLIALMVVPFISEAMGGMFTSVAWVARLTLLIDEAGNVALTAYDIVNHPASAPAAILGMLVGPMELPSKGHQGAKFHYQHLQKAVDDRLSQRGPTFASHIVI